MSGKQNFVGKMTMNVAAQGNKRIFADEELKEMGTQTVDLIKAAVDSGNLDRVKDLADRMYSEFMDLHDMYMYWVSGLMSFIARREGDTALEEALRDSFAPMMASYVEDWKEWQKTGNHRAKAERTVLGLRGHGMPIKVLEDDEKFIFEMQPCGSGGRLVQQGAYEAPISFMTVDKAQPLTFDCSKQPIYCTHAAILTSLGIELGGTGMPEFPIEVPSASPGVESCKIYVYKDSRNTPEEIFLRLGKQKPKVP